MQYSTYFKNVSVQVYWALNSYKCSVMYHFDHKQKQQIQISNCDHAWIEQLFFTLLHANYRQPSPH